MTSIPPLDRAEGIRKGIAGYAREQAILLRLLRMKGSFTANEFDKWLKFREYRRPRFYPRAITGDTLLLGLGQNGGNQWATWLDLLQHMMYLDLVDAKTENGVVVYKLPR